MSFILDALRKSENERQRDATASLSRAPVASTRQRTPPWTWILIAALSIALVAITTVWWRGDRNETTIESLVPQIAAPAPRQTEAVVPSPAASQGLIAPSPESLIPPPLQSARELAALDPNLPRLRLELLAYNGRDPSAGSAWINGQRYFVGERVANGPELTEVRPDGVILTYGGQRFLLTTR